MGDPTGEHEAHNAAHNLVHRWISDPTMDHSTFNIAALRIPYHNSLSLWTIEGTMLTHATPSLCSNPNLPRSIRARTGATTDPIPKGKKLDAHPQCVHCTSRPAQAPVMVGARAC